MRKTERERERERENSALHACCASVHDVASGGRREDNRGAMKAPFFIVAALLGLSAVFACGDGEEEVAPAPTEPPSVTPGPVLTVAPTPVPEGTLWRWVNVTLVIPATSDVLVDTDVIPVDAKPPAGGPAVRLTRDTNPGDDIFSTVLIDAETGLVVSDEVRESDRAPIDAILLTKSVGALNRAAAPWPYNDTISSGPVREVVPPFGFVRPVLATGLRVYGGITDPCCEFIGMTNGRSTVTVSLEPNNSQFNADYSHVSAEDLEAMTTWVATITHCRTETEC
jgi:hypothetical protein